ncbi:hypothetical protein D3C87_1742970 [compost metagenome]
MTGRADILKQGAARLQDCFVGRLLHIVLINLIGTSSPGLLQQRNPVVLGLLQFSHIFFFLRFAPANDMVIEHIENAKDDSAIKEYHKPGRGRVVQLGYAIKLMFHNQLFFFG